MAHDPPEPVPHGVVDGVPHLQETRVGPPHTHETSGQASFFTGSRIATHST